MHYGLHIATIHKCPDYQGVQIIQFSLHAKVPFVTTTKCIDYMVFYFSSVLINIFHCISVELNDCLNRYKGWTWAPCFK